MTNPEKNNILGDEEDKERTLDDCVLEDRPECNEPVQVLVKYFCGTDMKKCGMMARDENDGHNWQKVKESTERAKNIIAQQFYVVGVLGILSKN